jgi:hypothetical protein
MALTKRDLLRQGVESQTSLVSRLAEQAVIKPIKHTIPGGKSILQQVDHKTMPKAIYNWLRLCKAFTEVTISFAKDPDIFPLKKEKVRDLVKGKANQMPWESHPEGREYLARILADVVNTTRLVKVVADSEGVWAYKDPSNAFGPLRTITEEDVLQQMQLVEEVKAEMVSNGENPATLSYHELKVGENIAAENWEPNIQFIPRKKKEYGHL